MLIFQITEGPQDPITQIIKQANMELMKVARRRTGSVLRERNYAGMSTLNFEEIIKEAQTLCPTVHNFLARLIQVNVNREKKVAPLVLIYSVIMFTRCHELSRVQRVNTVLLSEGQASHEVPIVLLFHIP